LYLLRMMMMMMMMMTVSVKQSVERELAKDIQILGGSLPQCHFIHHKRHVT
jgi:hypothetical protein